ncbi:50S ribosomal protein L18 [Candidatus Parcubacteria bacterium]|nr:50S ribosomal protein L18 [Candidatus Parcubacteria bacterium]
MPNIIRKRELSARRVHRTRARISGTSERPRLAVKRSVKHIYAQLIDDATGRTVAAASDKEAAQGGKPVEVAKEVGKILASKAVAAGIAKAVFDRRGYRYHGRVAALADGAREGGLTF